LVFHFTPIPAVQGGVFNPLFWTLVGLRRDATATWEHGADLDGLTTGRAVGGL